MCRVYFMILIWYKRNRIINIFFTLNDSCSVWQNNISLHLSNKWLCVPNRCYCESLYFIMLIVFLTFLFPNKSWFISAYVANGRYNVWFVDWGALCEPPCYPASVHNMRPVARCLADAFTFLRASGMPVDKTTCVGHSLGAHICGIMAHYLLFRVHRIIGKLVVLNFKGL